MTAELQQMLTTKTIWKLRRASAWVGVCTRHCRRRTPERPRVTRAHWAINSSHPKAGRLGESVMSQTTLAGQQHETVYRKSFRGLSQYGFCRWVPFYLSALKDSIEAASMHCDCSVNYLSHSKQAGKRPIDL
jgi:hypothetical protein